MAHTLQERYSQLVDLKLRAELVKKDGVVFNNRYEGDPKAGAVKIPVRDTEVKVGDYVKATGADLTQGATTYVDLLLDKDKAVNELIDGYDAAAVPDNLVADRLDSGAYSLALQMEKDATTVLEAGATVYGTTGAVTKDSIYETLVGMRTQLSKDGVPKTRRFALLAPEMYALLLQSPMFTRSTDQGDKVTETGVQGECAGFSIIEDTTLSATTDIIAGHPDWCCRVSEWSVPVHLQDLNGSGKFIGASAVQGRKVYGMKVTKKKALLIKKHA